ncbi:MAG: hypothetical protein KA143_02960 [Saprospiraceae bacterium]|nr:hypothetical protein [Saprospiraceae bacterium]
MKPLLLSTILFFLACSDKTTGIKPADLVNKTLEYTYGESIYHVLFDSDSTMHWEAMAGDEKGIKANETYLAEHVGENKIFITWSEENGIGVSQLLDFEKGIVYNHLIKGRKISTGSGKIKLIQ